MKTRNSVVAAVVASCLVLSGCSAMGTAIKKRNLDVKTQMSQTVWLEPSKEKTVYLQARNTSDKDMSDLQTLLSQDLRAKGYTVTSSPDAAYYWIQANVLKAEKMDLRTAQGLLGSGYEGAATGAALGAGITAYNSTSGGAILGAGLAAGLAGIAADALVEDVNYTMVTDLQISERSRASVTTDDVGPLRGEIARLAKAGDLMPVKVGGEPRYVARATWEMEKVIIGEITAGKNTQLPLMPEVPPSLLSGLTDGQKAATTLILQSTDRFTAVQGYAGVGKTTQFAAVKAAIDTLPEGERLLIIGLAPTHRAVKEMRDTGIDAQTLKSFVMDWQQRSAAGESVRYDKTLFLIDESSMLGNQDTAAAYRAIAAGDGRAVPVGDVAQLESPESGAPFRLMQERSPIDVAVMKEIVRQRDANLKSAVYSVIENKAGAALEKIEQVSPLNVPRRAGRCRRPARWLKRRIRSPLSWPTT